MRRLPLVLALALLLALPALGAATLYRNARYGFQIRVPEGFVAAPAPANEDGRTFRQSGGRAELLVWGWNNVLDEELAEALARAKADAGRPIAFESQGRKWYVLSWTDGRQIVYQKAFLGQGSGAAFRLTYPVARKSAFDPIVRSLEKSFRPGDLSQAH